jgi:hypothetical protein
MTKKMTIDDLAIMIERNMASKEFVREVVGEVLEVVKNIDEKMGDIKTSTASSYEVAGVELRVEALEKDIRKIKQKVKIWSLKKLNRKLPQNRHHMAVFYNIESLHPKSTAADNYLTAGISVVAKSSLYTLHPHTRISTDS